MEKNNHNWKTLKETPPDKTLLVKDEYGIEAYAQPTYYPFKLGENKTGRKYGSEVIMCEPYWDGGWMIHHVRLTSPLKGKIKYWKEIMEASKKAKELANKFVSKSIFDMTDDELRVERQKGKKFAIICVDEILNDNPNIYDTDRLNHKYWKEVKRQIELL